MRLTGGLFDANNASGTIGMLLQTTGTGTQWVATSTLGITVTNFWSQNGNSLYNNTGYQVGINSSTPIANFSVVGSSTAPTLPIFAVASSSGAQYLTVTAAGNVGIGTTSPSQLFTVGNNNQFTVTSGGTENWNINTTSNVSMLQLNTTDSATYGPFQFAAAPFAGVNPDGRTNNVVSWGWNIGPNGAQNISGQPAARMAIESHYEEGGNDPALEIHPASFYSTTGAEYRPIDFDFTYTNNQGHLNQISASFATQDIAFKDSSGTNVYLQMIPLGATANAGAGLYFTGPSVLDFQSNNYCPIEQQNAAANAQLCLIELNASNQIVVDTGGFGAYFGGAVQFSGLLTGVSFGADVNFNGNTAIFGSAQAVRQSNNGMAMASAPVVSWSATTHAYDAADTGISRLSAGVVAFGTGAQGSVAGSISANNGTFSGNVGIGTTSPAQGLHIGSAASGKNVQIANGWLCVDNNDTCTGASTAGTVYAVGTYTTGADVAENYPTSDASLEAGDVVAADGTTPVQVVKATSTSPILGVVSTKPGVLLNGYKPLTDVVSSSSATATTVPVALSGRVPVKVSEENGPVQPGDYLVASSIHPGYAAKAVAAGSVIGRALERFGESGSDLGKILMFMQSGYYQPTVADLLQSSTASQDSGWLNSLGDLNMTDALAFGNIAVRGSVAIQKDLHVAGVIYAATLKVDTLVAKKLCLDDVCITKPELQQLLQLLHNGSAAPTGSSVGSGTSAPEGSVAGTSTTSNIGGADSSATSSESSSTSSSPPDSGNGSN